MTRTAYASVRDGNDATTSITYTIPEAATSESVIDTLDIALGAHVRVHGDEYDSISVHVDFTPNEPAAPEKVHVEMLMGGTVWCPSASFPGEYTPDEAEDMLASAYLARDRYRLVPVENDDRCCKDGGTCACG